jgi:hypothetical protein
LLTASLNLQASAAAAPTATRAAVAAKLRAAAAQAYAAAGGEEGQALAHEALTVGLVGCVLDEVSPSHPAATQCVDVSFALPSVDCGWPPTDLHAANNKHRS